MVTSHLRDKQVPMVKMAWPTLLLSMVEKVGKRRRFLSL